MGRTWTPQWTQEQIKKEKKRNRLRESKHNQSKPKQDYNDSNFGLTGHLNPNPEIGSSIMLIINTANYGE